MIPYFSFQSSDFQEKDASSADLKLVAGTEGVTLFISKGAQLLALRSWQFPASEKPNPSWEISLGGLLGAEKLLEWNYASKTCAFSTLEATLVPRRLFNPADLAPYFRLLLNDVSKYHFGHSLIPSIDGHLVWAVSKDAFSLIGHYFSYDQCRHLAESLINSLSLLTPTDNFGVYCNIRGQGLQIFVFDRGQLAYYNYFHFSKPSDLLYYLLLAYKQFDLNPLQLPLHISGSLAEDSEIYRLLQRYFRTILLLKPAHGLILPTEAQNLPAHFWFDVSTV